MALNSEVRSKPRSKKVIVDTTRVQLNSPAGPFPTCLIPNLDRIFLTLDIYLLVLHGGTYMQCVSIYAMKGWRPMPGSSYTHVDVGK